MEYFPLHSASQKCLFHSKINIYAVVGGKETFLGLHVKTRHTAHKMEVKEIKMLLITRHTVRNKTEVNF